MEKFLEFITSKTGIFAAIVIIITLISSILGILRPWVKNRKDKKASIPKLEFADFKTKEPPPWSNAGEITFSLVNASGGKAVMIDMWLHVNENGPCDKMKQVKTAAPVPQYTFKVKLNSKDKKYDVRAKKFGPKPKPHSFEKDEVEAFIIELVSSEPQWYKFLLEIEWYITAKPDQIFSLKSQELYMEFLPERT